MRCTFAVFRNRVVMRLIGKECDEEKVQHALANTIPPLFAYLDKELEGKDWIAGDFSIADMAIAPWVNALEFYGTKDAVGYHDLKNVPAYVERFFARPAVEKAKRIPDPS